MISYKSILPEYKDYVAQIPVDTLMKVGMAKQQEYNQNVNQIQNSIDYYANIPSLPGADTEKKNEIINQMTSQLNKLGKEDFGSRDVMSQVEGYVSEYQNSPDLQAIANRASKYIQLEKKRKQLTDNGETLQPWDMQGLNEIHSYIQNGKYVQNKQFNGDVYKSYNFDNKLKEYMKDVEEQWLVEGKLEDGWRNNYDIKQKTESEIREAALARAKVDPDFMSPFLRMYDYNYRQNPQAQKTSYLTSLQNSIEAARLAKATSDKIIANKANYTAQQVAEATQASNQAAALVKNYTDLLVNVDDDAIYEAGAQEYLDHMIGNTAKSFAYNRVTKRELDSTAKLAIEHSYKMDELSKQHDYKMEELGLTFGNGSNNLQTNIQNNPFVKFMADFADKKDGDIITNSPVYGTFPSISYKEGNSTVTKAPDAFIKRGNTLIPIATIEETTTVYDKDSKGVIIPSSAKQQTKKRRVEGNPISIDNFIEPDKLKNKAHRIAALQAQQMLSTGNGNLPQTAKKLLSSNSGNSSSSTNVTFKVGNKLYNIPSDSINSFKRDFPNAIQQ